MATEIIAAGQEQRCHVDDHRPSRPRSARRGWRCWTRPITSSSARRPQGRKMPRKEAGRAGPRADLHRADGRGQRPGRSASARLHDAIGEAKKAAHLKAGDEGRAADPAQGQVVLRAALRRFQRVDRSRLDPARPGRGSSPGGDVEASVLRAAADADAGPHRAEVRKKG